MSVLVELLPPELPLPPTPPPVPLPTVSLENEPLPRLGSVHRKVASGVMCGNACALISSTTPFERSSSCFALSISGFRWIAVKMACSSVNCRKPPISLLLLLMVVPRLAFDVDLPSEPPRAGPSITAPVRPRIRKSLRIVVKSSRIRCARPCGWIQLTRFFRSLITLPEPAWQSLRLAVIVNLAVDVEPILLLVRREVFHNFHEIANHFFADSSY